MLMKRFPKTLPSQKGHESVLDESRILMSFRQATDPKEVDNIANQFGFTVERYDDRDQREFKVQINNSSDKFWLRDLEGRPVDDQRFAAFEKNFDDLIEYLAPVYHDADNDDLREFFAPAPNTLLLNKKRAGKSAEIDKEFGLQIDEKKSRYLSAYNYYRVEDVRRANAFELKERLEKLQTQVQFEKIPMVKPLATTIPNDTLFVDQWNMTQINATAAWDISTGSNTEIICVLDEGCDLTHPDLRFSEDGINLGTMLPPGSPTGNHGTACAGVAAATFNNGEGVAGLAGNCLIMPLAFATWSDVEVANGINYATTNGARVISMSFGWNAWNPAIIDPEIQNAFNNDVVMCVATHNQNGAITYPATNPLVMACGASSIDDNRKSPTTPDGENWWGSNFGDISYGGVRTGVSVVAPGVQIPTTDRQGADGYDPGNYDMTFNGTSSATPLVAGLVALVRSQYPTLTNVQVRSIIEKTAAKGGSLAYTNMPDFPNGPRNEEMGYGRIDAFRALDIADLMIKDWAGDDGIEPSTPPGGDFWDFSDIVVRINDDNVFNPSNPSQSKNVEKGQPNFIYIQVTNNGPREARNVVVDCRITPYVGLQFHYPTDWTLADAMHVQPASIVSTFGTLAPGATALAKFTISAAQTDSLYGWQNDHPWHPCLLANVTGDNDYSFATASFDLDPLSQLKNNLSQRNLSVIDVLVDASASPIAFPFIAGHYKNVDRLMELVIENPRALAGSKLLLNLNEEESVFPLVKFEREESKHEEKCEDDLIFLETTKVQTVFGCSSGVLTLEKGSRFSCSKKNSLQAIKVTGGEIVVRDGKTYVELRERKVVVQMEKEAGKMYPMSVSCQFGSNAKQGDEVILVVSQRDQRGKTVGGATAIYQIK